MIALWHFYWAVIVAGLLFGFGAGKLYFRPMPPDRLAGSSHASGAHRLRRRLILVGGAAIALTGAAVWHGPLGAGDRLAGRIEKDARTTLDHFELQPVSARLDRSPLRRRLVLSGPGDDFQQRELVRIMDEIPGVSAVQWANPPTAPVYMK
jgi:hypothetical protein